MDTHTYIATQWAKKEKNSAISNLCMSDLHRYLKRYNNFLIFFHSKGPFGDVPFEKKKSKNIDSSL